MAIYFIEMDSMALVKIGFTDRDPQDRLRELQTACPFKLRLVLVMAGGLKHEADLHQTFAHLRAEGEWFRLTPELQTYLSLARFVFPRLNEMEDRLEKCRDRLESMSEEVDRLSILVGGQGHPDEPPSWMWEIHKLRDELTGAARTDDDY